MYLNGGRRRRRVTQINVPIPYNPFPDVSLRLTPGLLSSASATQDKGAKKPARLAAGCVVGHVDDLFLPSTLLMAIGLEALTALMLRHF